MAEQALAADGNIIRQGDFATSYGYDAGGNLITETLTAYGRQYVKTYTWSAGKLIGESQWVPQ